MEILANNLIAVNSFYIPFPLIQPMSISGNSNRSISEATATYGFYLWYIIKMEKFLQRF